MLHYVVSEQLRILLLFQCFMWRYVFARKIKKGWCLSWVQLMNKPTSKVGARLNPKTAPELQSVKYILPQYSKNPKGDQTGALKGVTFWDSLPSALWQNIEKLKGTFSRHQKLSQKSVTTAEKMEKRDPFVSPGFVFYDIKRKTGLGCKCKPISFGRGHGCMSRLTTWYF